MKKFRLSYGIIKVVASAILLGLLIFLSTARFFSSIEDLVFKIFKPVLSVALNWRQYDLPAGVAETQKTLYSMTELEKLRSENETLHKALRFGEEYSLPLRGGRIIHYQLELGHEFILIDQGSRGGIKSGDLAVDYLGFLVGTVKDTSPDISRIEVASNPGTTFEVEVLPRKIRALAKGLGARAFSLELLPAEAAVQTADPVQLLGIGGARFSFPLAEVASYEAETNSAFRGARAVLLSRPEALREVFIVEVRP